MIKKNNSDYKPASSESKKKFLKTVKQVALVTCVGAAFLNVGFMTGQQMARQTYINSVTSLKDREKAVNAMHLDERVAGLDDPITVFPRSGKLTINVRLSEDKQTPEIKWLLRKNVEEINRVFSYVNPKYSVKLEYNPKEFKKMYSIDLLDSDIAQSNVLGMQIDGDCYKIACKGVGMYNSGVVLDIDKIKSLSKNDVEFKNQFSYSFLHEVLGHSIGGMKDAYEIKNFPTQTLMDGVGNYDGPNVQPDDIKVLIAKFGKGSNYDQWVESANEYFNTTDWYISKLKETRFLKENVLNAIKKEYSYLSMDFSEENLQTTDLGEIYYGFNGQMMYPIAKTDEEQVDVYGCVYNSKDGFEKGWATSYDYYPFTNKIDYSEWSRRNYTIDGVRYIPSVDEYIVKLGDKYFGVDVEINTKGDYVFDKVYKYDEIAKEDVDTYLNIAKELNENAKYTPDLFTNKTMAVTEQFCKNTGITKTSLPELKGKTFTTDSEDTYIFDEAKNTIKFDGRLAGRSWAEKSNLQYKIVNDCVLCSNGDVIVNDAKNGLSALKIKFNLKTGNFDVLGSSAMQITKQPAVVSSFNAKQDNENNAAANLEKNTVKELYDHARKVAQKEKKLFGMIK